MNKKEFIFSIIVGILGTISSLCIAVFKIPTIGTDESWFWYSSAIFMVVATIVEIILYVKSKKIKKEV